MRIFSGVNKLVKKIAFRFGYNIVPSHIVPMDSRQMGNMVYLARMFERVKDIKGSVVECGVGRGRTFLEFAYLIFTEGKGRNLWGFDSFEGFPEPAKEDEGPRNPKKGEWSGTSPEDIIFILKRAGLNLAKIKSQVKLVPGFLSETLHKYDGGPIALLHIDVDLYEAYRTALNVLFPHVAKGGLVLFDEYGAERWPGAKKAVDEYFKNRPEKVEYDAPFGKYYVVKQANG